MGRLLQYIFQPKVGKSRMYKGRGHPPPQDTTYMVYFDAEGNDTDKPEEWVVVDVFRELWMGPEPAQVHYAEPLSVMDEVHESSTIVVLLKPKPKPAK